MNSTFPFIFTKPLKKIKTLIADCWSLMKRFLFRHFICSSYVTCEYNWGTWMCPMHKCWYLCMQIPNTYICVNVNSKFNRTEGILWARKMFILIFAQARLPFQFNHRILIQFRICVFNFTIFDDRTMDNIWRNLNFQHALLSAANY